MKLYRLFILFFVCVGSLSSHAQDDKKTLGTSSLLSAKNDSAHLKDSAHLNVVKKDTVPYHNPRIATRRSALIPGWGQAYNKEYWKIPVIYGVLSIPVIAYFYNNSYYKKTKFAYEARFNQVYNNDSTGVPSIDPQLVNLSITSLETYRNSFRRDRDYSILWFLIAWGVQVADATVFAHLKQFDVSSDLSMEINPGFNSQTRTPGLSLTLNLKSPSHKPVITR